MDTEIDSTSRNGKWFNPPAKRLFLIWMLPKGIFVFSVDAVAFTPTTTCLRVKKDIFEKYIRCVLNIFKLRMKHKLIQVIGLTDMSE